MSPYIAAPWILWDWKIGWPADLPDPGRSWDPWNLPLGGQEMFNGGFFLKGDHITTGKT